MIKNKPLNRIKVVLAEKNVSNKTLAEQIGVGQATMSKWVTNTSQPSLEMLVKISKALGVTIKSEKENKETLLGYFSRANRVEVYTKHDRWAKDGWPELADWSTDDNVLFLLGGVEVLICIPKKDAISNNLIEA